MNFLKEPVCSLSKKNNIASYHTNERKEGIIIVSPAIIGLLLVGLFFISKNGIAQSLAQRNASQRYEIDAKRTGTDFTSKDALPRSREFIRIDSTYYVGWMYEGMYKSKYAADYLGYKNAVPSLRKALDLLERDYSQQLRIRTSDLMTFYPTYRYKFDYNQIAYQLMECLSNIEQPDQVYALLRRAQKWNFQDEGPLQAYCYLAWTTHRNRFYTSSRYSFLKNSVPENEALAQKYLDSAMRKLVRDQPLNSFFPPDYAEGQRQSVYHYRALIYNYNFQMDSARKYYGLMKNFGFFSHNNYAIFLTTDGDFREAYKEFDYASGQNAGDKHLQEWAYYSSILNIYRSRPEIGVAEMKDMIQAVGSTPGFGWYNIALARSCIYNGDIEASERYIKKAEGFKEIHIGTTLGQAHYDFSVNLVKLRNLNERLQMKKFENRRWWLHPSVISEMANGRFQKFMTQYLLINQLAQNPERDMVVYKLFSSESTIAWDEVWYMIRDFTTNFFLKKYQFEQENNQQRQRVNRYFNLFIAKFMMEKGDYKEADKILKEIALDKGIDEEYEQLFVARVFESMAICADKTDHATDYITALNGFYESFPQLVPFSDLTMRFRLSASGTVDKKLISRLEDCKIDWTDQADVSVSLYFATSGDKKTVTYSVVNRSGREIVPKDTYAYTDSEKGGVMLAYLLFRIGAKYEQDKDDTALPI